MGYQDDFFESMVAQDSPDLITHCLLPEQGRRDARRNSQHLKRDDADLSILFLTSPVQLPQKVHIRIQANANAVDE